MSDPLIDDLRKWQDMTVSIISDVARRAADKIETLTAEVERLRAALEKSEDQLTEYMGERMNIVGRLRREIDRLRAFAGRVKAAISNHHAQKADDRCWMDDDELYAAAGLPPVDRSVGDKFEILKNCARFIDRRCEGGHWPSYAELEAEIERLRQLNEGLAERVAKQSELLSHKAEREPSPGLPWNAQGNSEVI